MSKEDGNGAGGVIGLIILIGLGVWAWNSFLKPDRWQGMYEVPTTNTIGVVTFQSKDECIDWLAEQRINPDRPGAYSFECGSNCQTPETELGFYKCKETFD